MISILNREWKHPTDGWYHLEAKGNHPNRAARVIQVIDNKACQSIVNRFNSEADANPNFEGMLIDREHFKHYLDKDTIAYGWLMRLKNRPDGIYGKIRWSETGKKAVDGGDYRHFSSEYNLSEAEFLNSEKTRIRPMRLDGLTLTNQNNNKGQKPITNREHLPPGAVAGAGRNADLSSAQQTQKQMKTVCTLLGLSADASEESVHAAVTKLMNRTAAAEKELEPVRQKLTETETALKTAQDAQLETDLETYKNRYAEDQREFVKSMLITNRASAIEYLKSLKPVDGTDGKKVAPDRVHNRGNATPPPSPAGTQDDATVATERQEAVQKYRIENRCSFVDATNAVRSKRPELFGIPARD
jgi:hypothetical protein